MAVTIVKQNRNVEKALYGLKNGDTFEFAGELYMKINTVQDEDSKVLWNTVHLATGGLHWYGSTTFVKPVDIEITVKEESNYAK